MRLSVISFTRNGMLLSGKIKEILEKNAARNAIKVETVLFTKCKACSGNAADMSVQFVESSVEDWAKEQMQNRNAMLFIGACGIAVRGIAPVLTDKLQDAPVLVMDETGRYVIPILAGHMGGANELSVFLAEKIKAEPVITTATDLNGKFAVDLFAKRNRLFIVNKSGIATVSSKVLAGEEITISIETGHGPSEGIFYLPKGIRLAPYPPKKFTDIVVASEEDVFDTSILLKPKEYILGIGCKKGKCEEEIGEFISQKINELGISETQIFAMSSIAQKKDEPGLVLWCQKRGIPFLTYTAEELQEVKGDFLKSSFVKDTVGVDNVCERAALKACESEDAFDTLLLRKCAENGITLAVAKREWKVEFYEE